MSRRGTALALCLSITLACKAEEPAPASEAAEPAPASEPQARASLSAGALVVISDNATLYTAPRRDAESLRMSLPADAPEQRVPGYLAEVLGVDGDFIEVRSASLDGCAGSLDGAHYYELRFFVVREALQPVLARPKIVEFGDGTKFELAPGVPVVGDDELSVGGVSLFVDLEDEDVGQWFAASAAVQTDLPTVRNIAAELHYGGRSIAPLGETFYYAHERKTVDRGDLLTLINACGRLTFFRNSELDPNIAAREAEILRLLESSDPLPHGCRPVRWAAQAGTTLVWPSGTVAGVVQRGYVPQKAWEANTQVCFDSSGGLTLCMATDKLELTGDPDCPDEVGHTARDRGLEQQRGGVRDDAGRR
jgi:hypothetical protein